MLFFFSSNLFRFFGFTYVLKEDDKDLVIFSYSIYN